jgi:lipopolysaccharide transport system permease protein
MIKNLRELWQYRGLLWALTARELKARYRASVLGFIWTFLNPTLNMVVYVLVFGVLMATPVERYPFFLFSGLLPWIYFSSSVVGGTTSVSDRRDLLTKVRFPAQVLPATVVLTNLINFLLSVPLLFVLGALYADVPTWHLVFAPVVLLVQTAFTLAVAYLLSALNVAFRDLQHIVANVVQMLFFLTPVLWTLDGLSGVGAVHGLALTLSAAELRQAMLFGNPLAAVMSAWRDILYLHHSPDWGPLSSVGLVSLILFWISSGVFERRREEFAELV